MAGTVGQEQHDSEMRDVFDDPEFEFTDLWPETP
jgi:hypothetical protein